ncbi:uncharacterized protein LOC110370726 [Helicoverpa armigera]|uniref:uncharacterized protein LOC110370726 n=1 Tax=Helicoverpa armigera TaxID=29058 RepID=UPI003082F1AA
MSYGTVVMKNLVFLFGYLFLVNADVYYAPRITDSMLSCDGFDNDYLNCDGLLLGSLQGEEGDDAAKLSGSLVTLQEILPEHEVKIEVFKMADIKDEFMYECMFNLCDSLQNTDSPWWPVIEKLNVTECPVPMKTFEVDKLTISLEPFKDFMCHDFCGEYRIQISFMDVADTLSCHVLELCIVECEDDE